MNRRIITPAPLFPVAISLMAGMVAGFCLPQGGAVPVPFWLLPAVLAVLMLCVLWGLCTGRWPRMQGALLLTAAAVAGLWLALRTRQHTPQWHYDEQPQRFSAVIVSEPVPKARSVAFDLLLTDNRRRLKCRVTRDDRSMRLQPGDGLLIEARITPNSDYRDGHFSYARYLQQHGFSGACFASAAHWQPVQVSLSRLSLLQRSRITFLRWRHHLLARYRLQGASADGYAVLAAMTLGHKGGLSSSLRRTYAAVGASHVLALSGLHLSILYFLLTHLTLTHRRRRLCTQVLLVAAIWAFALLAGLPVSLVRSATMLTVFALFALGGRTQAPVSVLCFAAIVLLVANPYSLLDVGFQLSFMAVLGILLMAPVAEGWLPEEWAQRHRVGSWLYALLTVSVAAQAATAPLVAYHFGQLPTYFLLTNLVVLPAAYLILGGTLLMLMVPWQPIAAAVLWLVEMVNALLVRISLLPAASIGPLSPTATQTALCYLMLLCLYGIMLRLSRHRL